MKTFVPTPRYVYSVCMLAMYAIYLYVKCIYLHMYTVWLCYSYIVQQVGYNTVFC